MLFDLSEESIEALKGMLGKYVESIYCIHMDWSIRQNRVTVFEDLVWSFKDNYVHMKAQEIDDENDYYSFSIKEQEMPDPLPYEIHDELGQLVFNSISSIRIWSKIEQISFHSLGDLKPEDPPYMAILFRLENDQAIGVTPNFPWGFNLYFDSAAWKLVEGSLALDLVRG
ncbi:hypothetical protein ACFOZY_06355 [Chungangia koreensis]|uniref:Uncharacterized protein n=1 Tax=Chungangia koreensis TaxID=752657 RepID=A0ABV8X429_9LACT